MFIDLGLIYWFCLDDWVFSFLVSLLFFLKCGGWVLSVFLVCLAGVFKVLGVRFGGYLLVLEAEGRWSEGSRGGVNSNGEKTAACVLLQCEGRARELGRV